MGGTVSSKQQDSANAHASVDTSHGGPLMPLDEEALFELEVPAALVDDPVGCAPPTPLVALVPGRPVPVELDEAPEGSGVNWKSG